MYIYFKKNMLPIGDDNSDRKTFPVVNIILIAINIIVFVVYQKWGTDLNFTFSHATVPGEIMSGKDIITSPITVNDPISGRDVTVPGLGPTPVSVYLTLLTSMFMHGGIGHIAGNMLYLLIFGDNLEDRMGHIRYLFFYLLCGILASLAHVGTDYLFGENHLVPSLGASGAISGVMGGYLLLFPGKKVRVLIFILLVRLPAFIVLGFWIALQIANGTGYLGGSEASGIAYAAHVGGFAAGLLLVKAFVKKSNE
jgi:membrane associated rhomboid family serine protease